jgi:hypothetical protein
MNSVRRCQDGKKQKFNSNNKTINTLERKSVERKTIISRMKIKENLVMLKNNLRL